MSASPEITDIAKAVERLRGFAVFTPLLESPLLNAAIGRRILVKAECLQQTGSFKFRGAWNHINGAPQDDVAKGVLAFSSGNHAQGVAYAAQLRKVPATIIMPSDAPTLKLENTRAYGADVVTYDRAGGESREVLGARLEQALGRRLIKPFDDPFVIAGQGSVGVEIADQVRGFGDDAADVAVCCGGGGLSAGIALALEAKAPAMRVRPVEPEKFDDWSRSLAAGEVRENVLPSGSICDAIVTKAPGEMTWPIGKRLFGPALVVSDMDARRAMAIAYHYFKIVVEPGGAVALAAVLFQPEQFKHEAVVAVATGGNVDWDQYRDWIDFTHWRNGLPIEDGVSRDMRRNHAPPGKDRGF